MTILDIAKHLLDFFSPEERNIPESVTYPGRHAAVRKAMNAALQEVFERSDLWSRPDERGALMRAPKRVVIEIEKGAATGKISTAEWEDWMSGCAIAIDGAGTDNQVKSVSNGNGPAPMILSGILSPDVTGQVEPWGIDADGKMTYTTGGVSVAELQDGVVIRWTNIWTIRRKTAGVFDTGFWTSSEDVATPDLVSTWSAFIATGDPMITAGVGVPLFIAHLKLPFTGESGAPQATVFCDALDLADDVLDVHEPVKFDRRALVPSTKLGTRQIFEDYGFRHSCSDSTINPRIVAGIPRHFTVSTYPAAADEGPRVRMTISPPPAVDGMLEYRAKLRPPTVQDITSAETLPMPFDLIESVFLPVAAKKLREGCPFWGGFIGDSDVDSSYQAALKLLKDASPRKRSGIRLRFRN